MYGTRMTPGFHTAVRIRLSVSTELAVAVQDTDTDRKASVKQSSENLCILLQSVSEFGLCSAAVIKFHTHGFIKST